MAKLGRDLAVQGRTFGCGLWLGLLELRNLLNLRRIVSRSGRSVGLVKRVPGSAHRPDRIAVASPTQRLPQAADMDVHGALVDLRIPAPDPVEELAAREHAARLEHQELQEPILGRAESDLSA